MEYVKQEFAQQMSSAIPDQSQIVYQSQNLQPQIIEQLHLSVPPATNYDLLKHNSACHSLEGDNTYIYVQQEIINRKLNQREETVLRSQHTSRPDQGQFLPTTYPYNVAIVPCDLRSVKSELDDSVYYRRSVESHALVGNPQSVSTFNPLQHFNHNPSDPYTRHSPYIDNSHGGTMDENVKPEEAKTTIDQADIKAEYICSACNGIFPNKRALKQHSKACVADEERIGKYACSFCSYKCNSPVTLKTHERTHTGEKPFSCNFCDYKSSQKNNVAKHILVHLKSKPYKCQYCDYCCAQKNNLVVHERTHTGVKPFACTLCDYKTVQKPNLVKHMYLHSGLKPFGCDRCAYRCVQKTNLAKHRQKHLNEDSGKQIQRRVKDGNEHGPVETSELS